MVRSRSSRRCWFIGIAAIAALLLLPGGLSDAQASSDCDAGAATPLVEQVRYGALTVDATTRGVNAVAWYGLGLVPESNRVADAADQVETTVLAGTPLSGLLTGELDLYGSLGAACGGVPG